MQNIAQKRPLPPTRGISGGSTPPLSPVGLEIQTIGNNLASAKLGINALDLMIQNFQNSPGVLSAADQAALDVISAASSSLATFANTVPTPPTATPIVIIPTPPPAAS